MKSQVRGSNFLPTTLPSFGGYIRAGETNVEVPKTRKVAVNKIPAMSAICAVDPCFSPLFLSLLFSQVLLSLSLTLSLSLARSLSPSLSFPVEYGFEADRGDRRNERTTTRRRVYCVRSDADPVNP